MDENNDLLIQQMAALGISPDALAMLTHQIGRGEQMADTPMAQGQHVGNTYVAASPLEHLATAVRRYQGVKQEQAGQQGYANQLQQNQRGIAAGQTAASNSIEAMIRALREGNQPKPVPGSIPGAAPVGSPGDIPVGPNGQPLFGPGY